MEVSLCCPLVIPARCHTAVYTATGFAMHEQQVTLVDDQTLEVAVSLTEL